MAWNEETLKQHIKNEELLPVYVLYGEESYLVGQYASKLCRRAMDGEDELDSFNLHRFDGLKCDFNEIEEAAEALPLMAERTCVTVRDYDVGTGDGHERLLTLLQEPNESCVLIFYYDAMKVSAAKNERWKTFLAAAEKSGEVVNVSEGELPKSFVVCAEGNGKQTVYLSLLNSSTLYKRSENINLE